MPEELLFEVLPSNPALKELTGHHHMSCRTVSLGSFCWKVSVVLTLPIHQSTLTAAVSSAHPVSLFDICSMLDQANNDVRKILYFAIKAKLSTRIFKP
jgi:hypothetical protein